MEIPQVSIVGEFEKSVITIDDKEVPDISVRNNIESGTVTFILDINSHAIDLPIQFMESFILFVADAMAQGAGYSSFGMDKKFNKFNRKLTMLGNIEFK